ncbi:MAG TPA: AraC family transcriptional regulator [Pseudomonadales bacterium]|nr:AraC family transcriptional regulator [Pseudomonadales bacterium]
MLTPSCSITPTPHVTRAYAQTLLECAELYGLDSTALLQQVGVQELGEEISVSQYLDLLQHCVVQTADQGFGQRLGQVTKLTTFGVNGILLLACPNLAEALQQVIRFECLVHDLGRSVIRQDAKGLAYVWNSPWLAHPAAPHLVESMFLGIRNCANWLALREIKIREVNLTHAPLVNQIAYDGLYGCTVKFNQAENSAYIDADLLNWRIPHANTSLFPLLQKHAETLLAQRVPIAPGIVQDVRQIIIETISNSNEHTPPKIESVASQLNMSTRTLQRKLASAGKAFQQLLDDTRLELAEHYLRATDQPISIIAYLIGYQEHSSFNHVFRARFGMSPSEYRANYRSAL